MPRYDSKRIETKWQEYWDANETFRTGDFDPSKEKLYVLDMFPYPSGNGLHVGHPEGYTATDITCRYNRMRGKQVLHPMGWDAFGLPAEQHAIATGTHPRVTTQKNIDTFRRQLKMLGFSYDWSCEISTTDPAYFRWTQWIFLQLFDSWYDEEFEWTDCNEKVRKGKGRPISELAIPDEVTEQGDEAVRRFQDKHRLAYQHEAPVNWCPNLGTVLANEEIIDGLSERGGHPVERIPLRQWMLRITSYAERLLDELDEVKWPESIKLLQRNWIGRSEGAEVDFYVGGTDTDDLGSAFQTWKQARGESSFPVEPGDDVLRIYTTRPDTLFGATFMVIAPEHPFVSRLTTDDRREAVEKYCHQASLKSDLDRTDLAKEKTGVFTGAYAINPVNGAHVPIWVADYVLISYGTGAIMAVPGHDLRDWEFAVEFEIPIIQVIEPPEDYEYSKEEKALQREVTEGEMEMPCACWGSAVNSGDYNGQPSKDFKRQITDDLASIGLGKRAINYRLRDWLFSRQHFWGEPFPIWHELDDDGNRTGLMRTDAEDSLPAKLPENFEFKPHGRPDPPLAEAPDEWLYKTDEDGTRLMRETNSMPQWAGSCWYYIRFTDSKNDQFLAAPEIQKHWLPVDLYIGGAEHAVLHLLYARFWHKLLFDRGHVSTAEPFQRLVNQGMILGEAELSGYKDQAGQWVSAKQVKDGNDGKTKINKRSGEEVTAVKLETTDVEKKGENFVLAEDKNIVVDSRAYKMSKSRGNVINPDDIVADYGADALRMYEMFMGPLEQVKPWSMSGVEGVYRFLGKVWRMIVDERAEEITLNSAIQDVEPDEDQQRILHKTIKAVTDDIEKLSFNTAISRMMEFVNKIGQAEPRPRSLMDPFVLLLSPFAPHIAEECWQLLGHENTLAYEAWPEFDESKIAEAEIEIPVQVSNKIRGKIKIPATAAPATVQEIAQADEAIAKHLQGKQIIKVVIPPGNRLVNFVVKG